MKNPWRTLKTKIVYQNPYWKAIDYTVIQPDKVKSNYYVVDTNDFVSIIPIDNKKETYLVRQWRYPIKQNSWENPQGLMDRNEKPLTAAKRELLEETGLTAKKWIKVKHKIYTSNGFVTQGFYIFIARELTMQKSKRDGTENDMIVKKSPLSQVYKMIGQGKIDDGPTIISFYYLNLF